MGFVFELPSTVPDSNGNAVPVQFSIEYRTTANTVKVIQQYEGVGLTRDQSGMYAVVETRRDTQDSMTTAGGAVYSVEFSNDMLAQGLAFFDNPYNRERLGLSVPPPFPDAI